MIPHQILVPSVFLVFTVQPMSMHRCSRNRAVHAWSGRFAANIDERCYCGRDIKCELSRFGN